MTTVETDQAEVRALLQRLLDAWKKNDGDAFAAEFAEDGDLIMFNGMHTRGRVQIALVMQTLFDTILKESSVAANVKDLRLLNADTALLVTLGGVLMLGETKVPPERHAIQTFVLTRIDGKWQCASFQNTRIQP